MRCPICNETIPDYSNFCLYCGARVVPVNISGQVGSTIEITRPSMFAGSAFAFIVYVDGKDVARLYSGKTAKVHIMPGKHSVSVEYGRLSASLEISIAPQETIKLLCGISQGFFKSKLFFARGLETESDR